MNGSGMNTPSNGGEIGGAMKAFILLVFLFIGFLFLSASTFGNVDLTPDTPAVSAAAPADIVDSSASDVIVIQDSGTTSNAVLSIPITGTCTDPYTVRQGDMLSSIAEICNTTIADIRLANPEIKNANLIYPGQVLRISAATVLQPTPIPVTGQGTTVEQPTSIIINTDSAKVAITTDNGQTQPAAPAVGAVPPIAPAIKPGTGMQVKGLNFPANTPVHIAIGPLNTGYNVIADGITDAAGNITATIVVPAAPDPTVAWVVVVATISDPVVQAASKSFTINSLP